MKKIIPNILTTYRLLIALLLPLFFYINNFTLLATIYITALLSDAFDGFLARKWNVTSNYGKIVDVIADKAIVIISTILFILKISNYYLINLIIEIILASVNIVRYLKTNAIKNGFKNYQSSKIGKFKTVLIFITLFIGFISLKITKLTILIKPLTIITGIIQIITIIDYTKKEITN